MYLIIDKECIKNSPYCEDAFECIKDSPYCEGAFAGAFDTLERAKEECERIFNNFVEDEFIIVGNDVERTETSIRFGIWDYGEDITKIPPTIYHYVIYEAKEISNDK